MRTVKIVIDVFAKKRIFMCSDDLENKEFIVGHAQKLSDMKAKS